MKKGSARTMILAGFGFGAAVGLGLLMRSAGPAGASILMALGGLIVLGLLAWAFLSGRRNGGG